MPSLIPPRPAVAAPVPISIAPLLKMSMPLMLEVPELMDRIVMAPLTPLVPLSTSGGVPHHSLSQSVQAKIAG